MRVYLSILGDDIFLENQPYYTTLVLTQKGIKCITLHIGLYNVSE